jgi:hypothetical protein
MALATINANYEQAGKSQFYLAAYPSGGYTGANLAAKITNAYTKFYTDGSQRYTPLTSQYFNALADGFSIKMKMNTVEVDLNNESKRPSFIQDFSGTLEASFQDVDVDHLKDLFSAASGDVISTAAASGIAGRDTLTVGNQTLLTKYCLMVRTPSGNAIARTGGSGYEFDHFLFPKVVCDFDADFKFSKKETVSGKVKFTLLYDQTIVDLAGNPIMAIKDTVKAVAL